MRRFGLVIVVAALLSTYPVQPAHSAPSGTASQLLGMYVGGGTNVDALKARENWLGRRIQFVQVSVRRLAGWAEWRKDVATNLNAWMDDGRTIVMSLPMAVEKVVGSGDTRDVAAGARGVYDDHWRFLGDELRKTGDRLRAQGERLYDRVVLRPGWEHNGPWYRHSSNPAAMSKYGRKADPDRPKDFAAYWRRAHDLAMRPVVAGNHDIRWEWNVGRTGRVADVEAAFPTGVSTVTKRAYAHVASLDVYDSNSPFGSHYPPQTLSSRQATFDTIKTGAIGLDWLVRTADRYTNGRLGLGEWGVQQRKVDGVERGGLDNPLFIANMADWLDAQGRAGRLQWHRYFDFDAVDGNHRLSPGRKYPFDKAAAEFVKRFGRSSMQLNYVRR